MDIHYYAAHYGHYLLYKTLPARLLIAAWCLVAIVLVNAYTSSVTSFLMAPRYHVLLDSIDDVEKFSRPIFMVGSTSSYESALMVSQYFWNSGTIFYI